ncbi:hypothetical protein MK489_09530 [Myxococcota bacterium]|nr:hypothetical protein [Myxococcota bacterium]
MSGLELEKPIFSSRAEDLSFRDSIDAFVVNLAERMDALQDAEAVSDHTTLCEQASILATDARHAGFEVLATCLDELFRACPGLSQAVLREQLVGLTRLAQRIRLGHRGSL